MKIAIVGPAHPYKGGIAQQATQLAHELTRQGNEVTLLSWKAMYPKLLYPGNQYVPDGQPEVPLYTNTKRLLNWKNPIGWVRQIRKLRSFDLIIFVWWVPTIQGPVYLTMLRALGKSRLRTVIICHNILPHEPRLGDKQLVKTVFNKVDQVIVHTKQQAHAARALTTTAIVQANLPATPLPPAVSAAYTPQRQLLFFGIVRPYKGLDVLLQALATIPDVTLTVAGEFWHLETYQKLLSELHLTDRVTLKTGYLANADLPSLFASVDALVLPYRSGSASSIPDIAHHFKRPVIATTASSLAGSVRDGIDGLLCEPGNVQSLEQAILHFYEPGVAKKLQRAVQPPATAAAWEQYATSVIAQSPKT